MVTRESACRIGNEDSTHNNHMLDTDHSRLVKFPGQSDDGYIRVKQTLESLVENAPAAIRGRFVCPSGNVQTVPKRFIWIVINSG